MPRADRKLFRILDDDVSRNLLDLLLARDGPKTQAQLTAALDLNSGTVSRRLGHLEDEGVVERRGKRGPYVVVHASKTRELLLAASDLVRMAAEAHTEAAKELSKSQRTEALAGGHLHDRAREGA